MNSLLRNAVFLAILLLSKQASAFDNHLEQETDSLKAILAQTKDDILRADYHLKLANIYVKSKDKQAVFHGMIYFNILSERGTALQKINARIRMSHIYYAIGEIDSSESFIKQLKPALNNIENSVEKAHAYKHISDLYFRYGDFTRTNRYLKEAIVLFTKYDEKQELAEAYNIMSIVQRNIGNINKALTNNLKAIEIWRELPNGKHGIASSYMSLGIMYKNQKDYDTALEYAKKAFKKYQGLKDTLQREKGIASCHNNIGVIYKLQGNFDKALNEYFLSLEGHKNTGNRKNQASVLHNVGAVLLLKGEHDKAMEYLEKALAIKLALGSNYHISTTYDLISEVYLEQKKYQKAEEYGLLALKLGNETGSADLLENIYETLTEIYAKSNQSDKFVESWQAYKTISDTLYSTEKTKAVYEVQAKYDLDLEENIRASQYREEKLKETTLESAKEYEAVIKREKEREELILLISLGLVLILTISLYSRFRATKKSRRELEIANRELKRTLLSKDEKEVLLKEIHHRVKNNMQIIMSLLRLQASNITDEHIRSLYAESQNRIKSMALVHEELYQTKDLTDVSVKNYLEKLIDNLILTYSIKTEITTSTNIQISKLGVDTLIPLGLLLNEIISNSFKHAFKQKGVGKIYVNLKRLPDINFLELKVGDNGSGFDKDPKTSESLGFELIESLVEQLDGTFEIGKKEGVHYIILFQEQEK